jgi:riboflavin kinase/FMN adenylyltransferase
MDFEGDLYGEEIRVDFIRHLREVRPFASVEALVGQMKEDVEVAGRLLREDRASSERSSPPLDTPRDSG